MIAQDIRLPFSLGGKNYNLTEVAGSGEGRLPVVDKLQHT